MARTGAVLMEVVFALSLFFVGAVFVMNGLNGALRGVNTIKLEADAADLAVTTFSEVQMGLTPLQSVGPVGVAYAGSEGWTYELVVSGIEDTLDLPQLKKLEIVVRNEAGEFAYRTTHLMWENPNPQPAVPGVDQVPSDLAGQIPGGDVAGALGGAGALSGAGGGGAAGGDRPAAGRGNFPDATPRFPQGGNGNAPDATPRFPPAGNNGPRPPQGSNPRGNGNAPDATPRFPQGGNRGNGNGGNNNPPPQRPTPADPENRDPEKLPQPPQRGGGR